MKTYDLFLKIIYIKIKKYIRKKEMKNSILKKRGNLPMRKENINLSVKKSKKNSLNLQLVFRSLCI